jgi:hypothetical protein
MTTLNSFGTRTQITAGGRPLQIYSLPALERAGFPGVARLPYSMKILLENLLRREDNAFVKPTTFGHSPSGRLMAAPKRKSPSCRLASCCRTSPACRASSISRRCATR